MGEKGGEAGVQVAAVVPPLNPLPPAALGAPRRRVVLANLFIFHFCFVFNLIFLWFF